MGICASSKRVEQEEECDENVVYVMDEQSGGGGGGAPGEEDAPAAACRKVASLFSQKGKKGPNQDAVILCQGFGMEDGVFCGVFDGHGRCGQYVSKLVRDYLPFMILNHRNVLLLDDDGDPAFSDASPSSSTDGSGGGSSPSPAQLLDEWREACANAFEAMDRELKLQPNLDCAFSGTTAVCAIKQGKDLIVANLGDSRAVLATMSDSGHLRAVQLTADHKPDLPREAERIKRCGGRVFSLKDEPSVQRVWLPGEDCPGLAMSRSLGDLRLKPHGVSSEPEVAHRRVGRGDLFIVLATDGVWDALSNEEVVSIVCATPRKQHASKAVAEAAAQRWRTRFPSSRVDDCSAVCLFLRDQDWGGTVAAARAKAKATAAAAAAAGAAPHGHC